MATGNSSFNKLVTTTLQDMGTEIFNSVMTNTALYYILGQKGNIKVVSGGRNFTHPVWIGKNTSYKSYTKLGVIDTPLTDNLTRAEYAIKAIAGSIVLSTMEIAMNSGDKQKLLDLTKFIKWEATESMKEEMGAQVWKDGSTATDFGGLQFLIADSPSTQTDVGGINPSTTGNDYWRNIATSTTVTAFNTGSEGLTAMNKLLNDCTNGTMGPKLVVTTKTVYGLYEIGLTSNIRYMKTDLADAGFRHLAYTTMPVMFDDACPSAHLYMVDTDNLWLQVLSRGNNEVTEFEYSHDQLSRIALMYIFGNLTTGSRKTNGVLTAING